MESMDQGTVVFSVIALGICLQLLNIMGNRTDGLDPSVY